LKHHASSRFWALYDALPEEVPYAPTQLVALAERHLGHVLAIDYDYTLGRSADEARFCTLTVAGIG
jgi:hypothetical protein